MMKFKDYAIWILIASVICAALAITGVRTATYADGFGDQSKAPATTFNLRTNQIRTRHLFAGSVTAGKIAFVQTTINVNAASATGSSAANAAAAGGTLLSCRSSGNQDQFMDNVVLNADGSITVTLAANATAQNNFVCTVVKADAKGVS